MSAVLEYLTAEVAELAGEISKQNKRARIIPRHILLAIRKDEELNYLLRDVMIACGGVENNIHQMLLSKGTKSKVNKSTTSNNHSNVASQEY